MTEQPVRVRFAPSPTGYLHVGSARTALFNWLYARQKGGVFLLRIEDTDRQRSTKESIDAIFDGLRWLGLDWDEAPRYQSEHMETHRKAAQTMLELGVAYRDFSSDDEAETRRAADRKEGRVYRAAKMRALSAAESKRRAVAGEPFVLRFKVPAGGGSASFVDGVYGPLSRSFDEIEDFALLRSDGTPVYMLSVVCDDYEMRVTLVLRGQDHLTNTYKQILIYEALGWPIPNFAHLPLILAPDRSKLSKRKHGEVVSVGAYRDRGLLAAAFRNFIALLGWSPGDDREIMTVDELIAAFSIGGINKSNAVFNFDPADPKKWTDPKAIWMNGHYLSNMPLDALLPLVKSELGQAGLWDDRFEREDARQFAEIVALIRARFYSTKDFVTLGRPYFTEDFGIDPEAARKNLGEIAMPDLLDALANHLETASSFDLPTAESLVRGVAAVAGFKAGVVINGARTALTGQAVGPSMFHLMIALGRDRCVSRLRRCANRLRDERARATA